jgi:hypothetical protein
MVLAGQKPETIMDICSRALSFWTYQVSAVGFQFVIISSQFLMKSLIIKSNIKGTIPVGL